MLVRQIRTRPHARSSAGGTFLRCLQASARGHRWRCWAAVPAVLSGFMVASSGSSQDLAEYFGFDGLEVVKIDRGAGPMITCDLNGDGLNDLIVVNNYKSRIEVHYQKRNASPDDLDTAPVRVNEFPEHWRFRREYITVSHRIGSLAAFDYDGDGQTDLIYAGIPSEIVFVRQVEPGTFRVDRRHPVKGLQPTKDSTRLSNVVGDERTELLSVVDGTVQIWSMSGSSISLETTLAAGAPIVALWVEDFDGDGLNDIAVVIPDDPAPLRVWLGDLDGERRALGPQLRFEMPPLVECEPVRLPGEPSARLAVIERPSRRLVVYQITTESVDESGDRDASMRVYGFTDASNKDRDVTVGDVDGDGLLDVIATDTLASAVVVYRQMAGKGLQRGQSNPSFAEIDSIAVGNVDDSQTPELLVLSEKESVVGRSEIALDGSIGFPSPLRIPDGQTPVAMNLVTIDQAPAAAVVVKDGRQYGLAIIRMDGSTENISLGSASRSPDSIVGLDADQDGRTDLLLLTRDKPMTMIRRAEDGFQVKESKDMGQFGLVQAATSENTAIFDIEGDGASELLIADRNFVRAVRFDPDPSEGVSPGWQVVRQINARDPRAKLVAIAVADDQIFAADRENNAIVVFEADASETTGWRHSESLRVAGFTFNDLYAGAFSGDEELNLLAVGDDGFAVIRLAGERVGLDEVVSWRADDERQFEHELTSGDVNSDGFVDLVALDAGQQMCEVFTFSELGHMIYATGFKVFESRIFSGGEPREFEPSECIVSDVTGDGAADLILLAHDRVLLYPQMTNPGQ